MSKAFDFSQSIKGDNTFDGFVLPTGSGDGEAGEMRWNNTDGQVEYWSSTSTTPAWRDSNEAPEIGFYAKYLVIGGGGGGASAGNASGSGGGGGAGGYRTNFGSGNISGGNSAVEDDLFLNFGTSYTVTVGAGGSALDTAGATYGTNAGSDSEFATITADGGGYGSKGGGSSSIGGSGGSGGGAGGNAVGGSGQTGQGFDGGTGYLGNNYACGGGGGAGGAGGDGTSGNAGGAGGDGLASSITGTSVTRAGGGGGGVYYSGTPGSGGSGGGGDSGTSPTSGTANTGSGGGGGSWLNGYGHPISGAGGSGVVIIRIPNTVSATFSAGVTASSAASVGSDRVYTCTAGAGTVTFTKD